MTIIEDPVLDKGNYIMYNESAGNSLRECKKSTKEN